MTSQLNRALFTAKVSNTTTRYFSVKGNTLDDEF